MTLREPVYDDGVCRIYQGENLEVLAELAGAGVRVHTTVTSPPYNTLGSRIPDKPTGMHKGSGWLKGITDTGYEDDLPEDVYQSQQRLLARLLHGVTVEGGSYFYNHKLRWRDGVLLHPLNLVQSFKGWECVQELIWRRPGAVAFNARKFAPSDERIYWLVRCGADGKPGDYCWNQDAASLLTVWDMAPPSDVMGHPCPYPLELPSRAISATTEPGDTVLDPYLGSGTTLRAAKDQGRRGIGIERREDYIEVAIKRLGQESLFSV